MSQLYETNILLCVVANRYFMVGFQELAQTLTQTSLFLKILLKCCLVHSKKKLLENSSLVFRFNLIIQSA